MPLAKSAPAPEVAVSAPVITSNQISTSRLDIGGVPADIYGFFSVPMDMPEKEVAKLKVISDWARAEVGAEGTEGDMLQKLCLLQSHLGYGSGLEKPYDKIFNYCKMGMYMKELEKRRDALRRRF